MLVKGKRKEQRGWNEDGEGRGGACPGEWRLERGRGTGYSPERGRTFPRERTR